MDKIIENNLKGPPAYENWKAYENSAPIKDISEYPIFSDARITGENTRDFGPYVFLNPVPYEDKPGLVQPSLYLRMENYQEFERPDMSETESERYHGGSIIDEIAALSSLTLGRRMKAGNITRYFKQNGDPLGHPIELLPQQKPVVLIEKRGLKIPMAIKKQTIIKLSPLSSLPMLSPFDAIILVRVARLYQDALWIAESAPSLAWLMLVSAVETAANHWRKSDDTPIERLKVANPKLVKILDSECTKGLSKKVAEFIVDSIGNAKKFRDFIVEFIPPPPPTRPPEWAQFSWKKRTIKDAMVRIYHHRSLALHKGMPFPAPMCTSPHFKDSSGVIYLEKSLASASYILGGTWEAKDTPVLLHTFEYIVRYVLLKWWETLASNQ